MTVDPAVLDELGRLRARLPELSGSVLATTDGMVVAHDAHGIEPDSLAALAAAHLALARRFAHAVNHGDLRESVVECDGGYITSYTAGPNALLTLVTSGERQPGHGAPRGPPLRTAAGVDADAGDRRRQARPEIPIQAGTVRRRSPGVPRWPPWPAASGAGKPPADRPSSSPATEDIP